MNKIEYEITQSDLTLLPPPKDCCQECGVKHDPTLSHNAQSFFYQYKFALLNKRSPTWADAMSHCSEEIKQAYIQYFTKLGIDINSTNLTGDLKSETEVKERLAK